MMAYIAGADPRRMTHCPACGSTSLTPVGSRAGLADVLAIASVSVPVGSSKAIPPIRKCRTCGWTVEAA